MPYNSSTSEYERRSTTVIDATPDGDTVAVAIDTKLDLAADDSVLDLNHHNANGNHYPVTSVTDRSRFLKQSPAGVVSWANGIPFEDGVAETELAASTGSAMVGHTGGTVKYALDARPTSATLAASGGSALIGFLQDGTGASARTVQAKLRDVVSVKDFGAVGDGMTDDTAAIQAALLYVSQNDRVLHIPSGTFLLSSELAYPVVDGLHIVGSAKSSAGGLINNATCLLFSHSGTPAVRLTSDNQVLQNLIIMGTGDRTTKNAGSIGVLIEGEDTETGAARSCYIEGVTSRNHGGSAFVTSGSTYHTEFHSCTARQNRGHSFVLSGGAFTGRTNVDRVGQVSLKACRSYNNAGHQILCYDEGFGAYRVVIENYESGGYLDYYDADLFVKPAAAVINGENIFIYISAFSGGVNGTPTIASLWVSGRVVRAVANRYIAPSSPAIIVGADAVKTAEDIMIDGLFVDQEWIGTDPFVHIETGVKGVTILSRNSDTVSNIVSGDTTKAIIFNPNGVEFNAACLAKVFESPTADREAPFSATRANSLVGFKAVRTGTGASTAKFYASGGGASVQTDSNQLVVKQNTVNIAVLPTSVTGLSVGDLWNDAGTVKVKI